MTETGAGYTLSFQEDGEEPEELVHIDADAPEDVQWVAVCAGHIAQLQDHPLGPDQGDYKNLTPTMMAASITKLAQARGDPFHADGDACKAAEGRVRGSGNYSGWGGYCGGPVNAYRVAAAYVKSYREHREFQGEEW